MPKKRSATTKAAGGKKRKTTPDAVDLTGDDPEPPAVAPKPGLLHVFEKYADEEMDKEVRGPGAVVADPRGHLPVQRSEFDPSVCRVCRS